MSWCVNGTDRQQKIKPRWQLSYQKIVVKITTKGGQRCNGASVGPGVFQRQYHQVLSAWDQGAFQRRRHLNQVRGWRSLPKGLKWVCKGSMVHSGRWRCFDVTGAGVGTGELSLPRVCLQAGFSPLLSVPIVPVQAHRIPLVTLQRSASSQNPVFCPTVSLCCAHSRCSGNGMSEAINQ